MRRLSSLDLWEVDAARRRQQLIEEQHISMGQGDDIDMQDNNEGGVRYQQYRWQQQHDNNRGFPPSMSLITTTTTNNNNNTSSSSIAAAQGHPPEEFKFAQVLELVMRGELNASGALQQYAKICTDRAGELKEQARAEVQRAARQAAVVSCAQELEAESATWQLLWHLYGVESRELPAGKGGNFADGAGLEKTFRQRAADVVFEDDEINRCARIVAWLEALSSEALAVQCGGGGGGGHHQSEAVASSFTSTDGLWRETKSRIAGGLMGRDAATLVNRVDPDAMTRQIGKRLLPENMKDEERLAVEIWRLVRAGKMSAAAKLCEAVGQPWRAAFLTGGGGPQGVLPVGTAALEADESEHMADVQAADLAVDVEGGEGVSRALWRWTCALAADRIAAASGSGGNGDNGGLNNNTTTTNNNNKGAVYESALYGVLSSHLARVLPVCKSWEDILWATLRCWLDAAVDIQLGVGLGDSGDACSLAELPFLASNQRQQTNEGGGDWPPEQLRDALPSSFQEAVSNLADGNGSGTSFLLSSSTAGAGAAPASYLSGNQGNAAQYRSVQNALMLESIQELVCEILSVWVIKKSGAGMDTNPSSSEQQQQHRSLGGRNQSFPSLQGGGGGGGIGMLNMDTTTTTTNLNDGENSPSSPPGVMRFAAHMALGLWGLGIMSPRSGHQMDTYDINNDMHHHHQRGEYSSIVQDTLHRLVQVYVARLIDSGAHNLVPLYVCHLRAGLRWMTYHAFFDQLIAAGAAEGAGGNMVECKAAYDLGDSWFSYWKQSGGNNNSSDEEGDMAEDEMAVIALGSVKRSRFEVYGGPMLRAQFMRWLCFGGVEEKAAAVHGANVLCREFALAGSGGLSAADALLAEIMPAALGQPLSEFLDELPELRQQQRKDGVVIEEEEEGRPSTSALFLEKQGLVGQIEELKCWIAYFHIQSEFASWCQLYAEAKASSSLEEEAGTAVTDHLRALGEETLPLLEEATAFVSDRQLQWLVEDTLPTDFTKGSHVPSTSSSPFEIAVVVGPEMGLEAPLSHQFPTFTDDQEVEAVSEGVLAAMRDAAASVTTTTVGGVGGGGSVLTHSSSPSIISGMEVAAGPAPEDMPSMLSIAIDYSNAKKHHQDEMTVAVALLGLVLKGATRLVGDDGMPLLGPLSIVNMDAHPLAAAELCRTVCYPRMTLMAAAMREAVAYMGVGVGLGAGEVGSGLVEAAAAADLIKYFSTMELKELLQYERATEVLQMRNVEKEKGCQGVGV